MSVFKSQFSRALSVIRSNYTDIPFPQVTTSGKSTSVVVNSLVDSTKDFSELNVAVGDIIYNTTDSTSATVIGIVDETTLLLNADIFTDVDKDYTLYNASSQNTIGNYGCNLYVAASGNVHVITTGGDDVIFTSVTQGSILPVQVKKVLLTGTTSTNIIALW